MKISTCSNIATQQQEMIFSFVKKDSKRAGFKLCLNSQDGFGFSGNLNIEEVRGLIDFLESWEKEQLKENEESI